MRTAGHRITLRTAQPEEFTEIGRMAVAAYASLPGMPSVEEQPDYYGRLYDVASRAGNPAITVFVAVGDSGELLGSVDFIDDMRHYGSGGTASSVPDAAGIRLLAVKNEYRGQGVGQALTRHCLARARELGKSSVILHTTQAMSVAWQMYSRMGFERFPAIDFQQGTLEVYGFRLLLS
jgi:GNAT superfamily N-acetyltransferase